MAVTVWVPTAWPRVRVVAARPLGAGDLTAGREGSPPPEAISKVTTAPAYYVAVLVAHLHDKGIEDGAGHPFLLVAGQPRQELVDAAEAAPRPTP